MPDKTHTATGVSPNPFATNNNPFGIPQSIPNRQLAGEGIKQLKGSMESTAASMEEDLAPEPDARAIPTVIQWPAPGNKVLVTGTFCAWEKGYKLTRK